jgi:uncharacterized protein YndB with AHSA1/START domain
MTGVYQEIVEPERLVFLSAALDEDGNALFEVLTTVIFAEQGGKTKQKLQARVIKKTVKAAPYLKGHGGRMDTEPGAPCRIPSKNLTTEQRKMPGCLRDGGCPNPDKASQDRAMRGLETEKYFA